MMKDSIEKEENKKGGIDLFAIAVIIMVLIFAGTVITVFSSIKEDREKNNIPDDNRFDITYTHLESVDPYIKEYVVLTDRETDVQYLVVVGNSGVSVTTMRDTNGAVLLRE